MAADKSTDFSGSQPPDDEDVVIDTTSTEPLRNAKIEEPVTELPEEKDPPRTSRGKFTAPKFGSAGSGGAELEPGPERN